MTKMDECINRFNKNKCNQWIIDTFETIREFKSSEDKDKTDYIVPRDYPGIADKICSECKHFKK